MILYINTIKDNSQKIEVRLEDEKGKIITKKTIKAQYKQAEKLLPLIDLLLTDKKNSPTPTPPEGNNAKTTLNMNNTAFKVPSGGDLGVGNLRLAKRMKEKGKPWESIKGIIVENKGGSFTALRIGIVTANALGYALGIPVASSKFPEKASGPRGFTGKVKSLKLKNSTKYSVVMPEYEKEPNITVKKSRNA